MQSRGDGGVGLVVRCCAVGEEEGDGQMGEEGSTVVSHLVEVEGEGKRRSSFFTWLRT